MKYLVDTSALVRIWRNQTTSEWRETAGQGVIAVCEPVLAEMLVSAESKKYAATEERICSIYPYLTIPDSTWDEVNAFRHELALHSAHQGPSVVDLVVASTALRYQLTVLHEDRDYETMARYMPHLKQQRISQVSQ